MPNIGFKQSKKNKRSLVLQKNFEISTFGIKSKLREETNGKSGLTSPVSTPELYAVMDRKSS